MFGLGGSVVVDNLDNPEGQTPPAGDPSAAAYNAPEVSAPLGEAPILEPDPPSAEATPADIPAAEPKREPKTAAPNGRASAPAEASGEEDVQKEWYILKVQSNREESIKEGLMRRVRAAGLDRFFGECIVPTEMVSEFKGGKKRVTKRKLYPGYLVVHMAINDDTWYLVRETTGIGDFTGSVGRPTPMAPQDVQKILSKTVEETAEAPKLKINFKKGDRVKINEGTFENFEGDVDTIDEGNGRVSVMINIFGRSTPVEFEYWQIEAL